MSKQEKDISQATLTLTVEYDLLQLPEVIESARDIIERASEQGKVEGYLDIHRASRIPVDDLR